MKYATIKKEQVFDILVSCSLDIMSPVDNITLVNIAKLLKTSRYQVKKHMDYLKTAGIAEYSVQTVRDEYEVYPICGYRLADTIKSKNPHDIADNLHKTLILQCRAIYQRKKAEHDKILNDTLFKMEE